MSDPTVQQQADTAADRPIPAASAARRRTAWLERARAALISSLFRESAPVRATALAGVGLLAAAVAALRLGGQGLNTLWAEDGQIFYVSARRASLPHVFFHTYRGYMHAVPRLVAAAAALLPLKWAAAAMALGSAVVLGLAALIIYQATQAHIRNPWLRLVLPALIVACPVGQETIGAVANLHWPLFFTAFAVLIWNPRRPAGLTAGALTVVLITLSTPFGVLLLPLAVVRAVVFFRDRGAIIPFCAVAGTAIQAVVMAFASGRPEYHTILPGKLTSTYLSGVTGQGFFGTRYHAPWHALGTAAVLAIAVVAALTALPGLRHELATGLLAILYSLLYFGSPVVLSGMTIGQPGGTRYFVGPLELLVFAIAVFLQGALDRPSSSRRSRGQLASAALCGVLLVCLGYSVATSYRAPDPARSQPTWSAALDHARQSCRAGARQAVLPITPISHKHHWHVTLSCAQIERG
jgi:hypothetical protein